MHKYARLIYLNELNKQCIFSEFAIKNIEDGLNNLDVNVVYFGIQSFLIAIANISKIFIPSDQNNNHIGEELKILLGINSKQKILSRRFRNFFEHIDTYMAEYVNDFESYSCFVDSNVGMIHANDRSYILRGFDSITWILTFQNKKYDIKEIIEEVKILKLKLDNVIETYYSIGGLGSE